MIAWYAHHAGAGHVTRAASVASRVRDDVVVLSTAARPAGWPADRWVRLEDDADPGGHDHTAGGGLHWAPTGHRGFSTRMRTIATWVERHDPALLVSDVSVEVALLGRLLGVPVAVTLMAGDRSDRAHRAAYDAASALVGAWPAELGAAPVSGFRPEWEATTHLVGGISRFDGREPVRATQRSPHQDRVVLALAGRGGDGGWGRGAAARPDVAGWRWAPDPGSDPDAVWAALGAADVVVTHGGQNALAEVAAARRPAVVVPDRRPHDEQAHLAAAVSRMGLAVTTPTWPAPGEWPDLLDRALALGGEPWSRWSDGHGAQRYADVLDRLVEGRQP